jgi:DNA polymerase III alpha subunit (gram-positive type)
VKNRRVQLLGVVAMSAMTSMLGAAAFARDNAPAQPAKEPTLDELLGIAKPAAKEDGKAAANENEGAADAVQKSATDPTKTQLDRELRVQPINDQFLEAVGLMKESADRLTNVRDAGLQTQRIQDEVIKKLDKLIDDAKKQSSQKKQQQQQQQQQEQQQSQQQQQQQSSQSQKQQQASSSNQSGSSNTPKRDGQRKAQAAGASAGWGDLPPKLRDALMQGSGDTFSATYERLTEEYYKRLAEQAPTSASSPAPAPVSPAGGGSQ